MSNIKLEITYTGIDTEVLMKQAEKVEKIHKELKENAKKEDSKDEKVKYIVDGIKRLIQLGLDPTKDIMSLATIDNKKFIEVYEQLQEKYKWRKIKFTMKCKQQLIYALKKKGWWWNTYKGAWSTYLDRVDIEWIKSISEKYEEYL